jgi:hypothetical protein
MSDRVAEVSRPFLPSNDAIPPIFIGKFADPCVLLRGGEVV